MKKISFLETKPSSRYDESDPDQEGNKNTGFADLIIDGTSFFQRLKKYDLVPCFGWLTDEHQKLMIDYFLFKYPFELKYHRYPLLVCPWCGDSECGYISVSIDKESDIVEWSNFYIEPKFEKINIGPFYFEWDNYKNAIENTFGLGSLS